MRSVDILQRLLPRFNLWRLWGLSEFTRNLSGVELELRADGASAHVVYEYASEPDHA